MKNKYSYFYPSRFHVKKAQLQASSPEKEKKEKKKCRNVFYKMQKQDGDGTFWSEF